MKRMFVAAVTGWILLSTSAFAQNARFYQGADGNTYRETTRIERRPVATTHWDERETTVYKEQYVTQMRDSYRTVMSPVTELRAEPRWHNWWNPFSRPYVAYHMMPRTHWETRYERYQAPVTFREVVPEKRIVRTPVRTPGFVDEQVTETVAVTPRRSLAPLARTPVTLETRTAVRSSDAFGGVEMLGDPLKRR